MRCDHPGGGPDRPRVDVDEAAAVEEQPFDESPPVRGGPGFQTPVTGACLDAVLGHGEGLGCDALGATRYRHAEQVLICLAEAGQVDLCQPCGELSAAEGPGNSEGARLDRGLTGEQVRTPAN